MQRVRNTYYISKVAYRPSEPTAKKSSENRQSVAEKTPKNDFCLPFESDVVERHTKHLRMRFDSKNMLQVEFFKFDSRLMKKMRKTILRQASSWGMLTLLTF